MVPRVGTGLCILSLYFQFFTQPTTAVFPTTLPTQKDKRQAPTGRAIPPSSSSLRPTATGRRSWLHRGSIFLASPLPNARCSVHVLGNHGPYRSGSLACTGGLHHQFHCDQTPRSTPRLRATKHCSLPRRPCTPRFLGSLARAWSAVFRPRKESGDRDPYLASSLVIFSHESGRRYARPVEHSCYTGGMDIASFVAATTIVKNLRDLTASLGDDVPPEVRDQIQALFEKVADTQTELVAAQQREAELIDRCRKLEDELGRVNDWETIRVGYELRNVGKGAFVFAPTPDSVKDENAEPAHWLCTKCFDDQKKSYLQRLPGGIWRCLRCKGAVDCDAGARP